ncbi:hypothetical protein PLESTM_001486800 [Pleodorina starrii]|nr:hypothetical protein PLESTM_001486800 [Pleodorina starrii]
MSGGVVRWIRSFPFGFITDRQYVIARALFSVTPDGVVHAGLPPARQVSRHAGGGPAATADAMPVADLYGITKSIDHPGEYDGTPGKIVQIPEYYSMWRCRAVACPWGGERPAVEVLLLHSENMKIPERLARMAIGLGMGKFVNHMMSTAEEFVTERRSRVAPTQPDPLAYGHHHHVYGPAARGGAAAAAAAAAAATTPRSVGAEGGSSMEHRPVGPSTPTPLPGPGPVLSPIVGSSAASEAGGGGGGVSVVQPARALWQPSPVSPGGQPQGQAPGLYTAGTQGGPRSSRAALNSRFSLAEVTLGNGAAGGSAGGGTGGGVQYDSRGAVAGSGESPAGSASSGGGSDAWASLGRAMTSTGLWRRQDLPPADGGGGGGAGRLLRRAALATVVVLVARHWRRGGPDGGVRRARSADGGKRGGNGTVGDIHGGSSSSDIDDKDGGGGDGRSGVMGKRGEGGAAAGTGTAAGGGVGRHGEGFVTM